MGVITDPIADLLTRIRNANTANHQTVDIPASKMKKAVAQILVDEGFVTALEELKDGPQGTLRRISRPGLRVYTTKTEIPRVLGGLGLVIMSTSKGIMSGKRAKREGFGGEVLAYVW
jgi:small subunit ribosomal protein S8